MKLPEKVREKVANLELKRKADDEREAQSRKRAEIAANELRKLKSSRKEEILGYAETISAWIAELIHSPEAERLFKAMSSGEAPIHHDYFWKGRPADKQSHCYASLWVGQDGKVTYRERYKGFPVYEKYIGSVKGRRRLVALQLFEKLHPEFLKAVAESLKTGKVWDWIANHIATF